MSAKNDLQEYVQKKKLPYPIYSSARVGGSDNQPQWVSTIVWTQVSYEGPIMSSKREAEKAVAEVVLNDIHQRNSQTCEKLPISENIYVDVENVPLFIEQLYDQRKPLGSVRGYLPKGHPLMNRFEGKVLDGFELVIVNSTRKDSVDLAIVYDIGASRGPSVIASRDHFADTIADIHQNIKVARTVADL